MSTLRRQIVANRHFYLFIAPYFMLFALFGLYPLVFSLVLSLTQWDGLTEIQWVGFQNFVNMLHDDFLADAIWNTVVLGMLHVPPMLVGAFFMAVLLNTGWSRMRAAYRTAMFMPVITPMVVVALVFGLIFDYESGVLNYVLGLLHLGPFPWITHESWSKPSLAILLVWRWTGYNMVLMLAGLQSISDEYYEAATLDGAGPLQKLWYITVPMMRPIFVFCIIMSLIGTVYMFDEIFVMTSGGPGTSSLNIGLYLFNLSFVDFKFGYASCLAYTVAAIVFMISLLIFRAQREQDE